MVCSDWPTTVLLTFLNAPSSLVPLIRSRTRIVESASLKSSGSISMSGSLSKRHFSTITDFSVLGFRPICLSNADFPSAPFSVLRANRIFEIPFLSRSTTIFSFVLNRSFIVLIILSTFPFPLWSRIGHITCFINFSSQNFLNVSLLKTVPGSVRILFGIPFVAIYSMRNSITFSAVGFGRNNACGHPEWLSRNTNKYFFCLCAF